MWKKLSLVASGLQSYDWAVSHATLSVVDLSVACRVYFSVHDAGRNASFMTPR